MEVLVRTLHVIQRDLPWRLFAKEQVFELRKVPGALVFVRQKPACVVEIGSDTLHTHGFVGFHLESSSYFPLEVLE